MTDSNSNILGGEIVLIRGAISNPQAIIDRSELENNWSEDFYTVHADGKSRRHTTSTWEYSEEFRQDLLSAYKKYAELLNYDYYPDPGESGSCLHISKYLDGGHIPPHTDDDYTEENGLKSVIIYLNDDYEGGEVGFSDYKVEIKPSAGDVLIFPCHYLHYSKPAKNGFKYMTIHKSNEFLKKDLTK